MANCGNGPIAPLRRVTGVELQQLSNNNTVTKPFDLDRVSSTWDDVFKSVYCVLMAFRLNQGRDVSWVERLNHIYHRWMETSVDFQEYRACVSAECQRLHLPVPCAKQFHRARAGVDNKWRMELIMAVSLMLLGTYDNATCISSQSNILAWDGDYLVYNGDVLSVKRAPLRKL